jgi:hypothetical protein
MTPILYDFYKSPTIVSAPWKLPDTFEDLKSAIGKYLEFEHEFKIVTVNGYQINDEVSFETLKCVVNAAPQTYLRPEISSTSPVVRFKLYLSINLMRIKSNKLEKIGHVAYSTEKGFEKGFIAKADAILLASLANSQKHLASAFRLYIYSLGPPVQEDPFENNETVFFEKNSISMIYLGPRGYSDFKFTDLDGKFEWEGDIKTDNEVLHNIANDALDEIPFSNEFQNYNSHFERWELERIIDHLFTSFVLLRISLDPDSCRTEANRRLILNEIFKVMGCLSFRVFSCEYWITREELPPVDRVGNGPLDFMIKKLVRYSANFEEIEKLSFFKKMTRERFIQFREEVDTAVPVITLNLPNPPPDINEDSDGGIVDDQVATNASSYNFQLPHPSRDRNQLYDVCEAKDKNLCTTAHLQDSLPQLISQMIDGLALNIHSRKRNSSGEGKEQGLYVRGMLSSGQLTLFFQLTCAGVGKPPKLKYLGKLSLKVFDKETSRQSGLQENEEIKRENIENVLKSFYIFFVQK